MMAGSLLFPTAPPSSLLFSSPSRLCHAWREHQRQCPICKTLCTVELVVLNYVNRHSACCCGGKGETRMGGEDCHRRQRQDDPDPPWGCGGDGLKRATMAGCNARAPPPHVDCSNNGGGGCGGAPCLLLSLLAAAAVLGQCHGDNATATTATTATTMATMACTVTAMSTATVTKATTRAPLDLRKYVPK